MNGTLPYWRRGTLPYSDKCGHKCCCLGSDWLIPMVLIPLNLQSLDALRATLPHLLSLATWFLNYIYSFLKFYPKGHDIMQYGSLSVCTKIKLPCIVNGTQKKKKNPIKTNLANHWVQGMKKYIWNYKRPILNLGTIQIYWLQIIRSAYKSFWLDIDRNKFQ